MFKVRVIMRCADPWFVAKDVCDCLELTNVSMACQTLDEDEKGINKVYTLGGSQDMMLISESGLYTLIMRSNKPEAKAFKRWVTHEVLPSIRKKRDSWFVSRVFSFRSCSNLNKTRFL